jgi:hypothetical protein
MESLAAGHAAGVAQSDALTGAGRAERAHAADDGLAAPPVPAPMRIRMCCARSSVAVGDAAWRCGHRRHASRGGSGLREALVAIPPAAAAAPNAKHAARLPVAGYREGRRHRGRRRDTGVTGDAVSSRRTPISRACS